MLVKFSVGNYRSFKDVAEFSMVAASIKAKDPRIDEENVTKRIGGVRLLKSAAIYGANAGGKTNLVKALSFMRLFVHGSSKNTQAGDTTGVEPFRLSTETEDQPSFFEIVFLMEGKRYRYGFEANTSEVVSEWLLHGPASKEAKLFTRDSKGITVSPAFEEGKGLDYRTRDNALFLSVVSQWNGAIAGKIVSWFLNIKISAGIADDFFSLDTFMYMPSVVGRDVIVRFVKNLDLSIDDIRIEEVKVTDGGLLSKGVASMPVTKTVHKKYDADGNFISHETLGMRKNESNGTQRLYDLAGPVIGALLFGTPLIVDELDARLHPLISVAIIKLFNSRETNPKGAQLIFTTHDTNLLSSEMFRLDQIWFAEKDRQEATDLYSLVEYKVKDEAHLERDYIDGRYGAIPFLGDIRRLVGVADE